MNPNLISILKELEDFKKVDRKSIFEDAVKLRLDHSMIEYCRQLSNSINYLKKKNELKVARRFNKVVK